MWHTRWASKGGGKLRSTVSTQLKIRLWKPYGCPSILLAYSKAALSLKWARKSGCKGSSAIWGFELSLVSSNSHHSSHGSTTTTSSPCNMNYTIQMSTDSSQINKPRKEVFPHESIKTTYVICYWHESCQEITTLRININKFIVQKQSRIIGRIVKVYKKHKPIFIAVSRFKNYNLGHIEGYLKFPTDT